MATQPDNSDGDGAMQWVSRVFAASLMMVLPGLGGQWLDRRWGTRFMGLVGFGLGLSAGWLT